MSNETAYNPLPEELRAAAGQCIAKIDARLNELYRAPVMHGDVKLGPSLEEKCDAAFKEDSTRTPLALLAHICVGESLLDGGNRGLALGQARDCSMPIAMLHAAQHGFRNPDHAVTGLNSLLQIITPREAGEFVEQHRGALEEALETARAAGGQTPFERMKAEMIQSGGGSELPGRAHG
jgi:hypothetical protein